MTAAPRSSHQGMATAEELPSLFILTLPFCLLKTSQGSFTPLIAILLHLIPSFHWRSSSNIPSLYLTHIHPLGHLTLLHSLHVAKPLQCLSFHFFHHSTFLPFAHTTHSKTLINTHYSFHPFYSHHMHSSNSSFPLPALQTSAFHSRPMFCLHL